MVAEVVNMHLPSETHMYAAKVSVSSETAAPSEAAPMRMSLGDMSGPLCGMPQGTITSAQVVNAAAPAAERQNRTPIYVTGTTYTRSFPHGCVQRVRAGSLPRLKGRG